MAVLGSAALMIGGGAAPNDVEEARAGLAARVVGMDPIEQVAPLADCPVVDRDAVVAALVTAGIDTPIESLLAERGPKLTGGTNWQATGVVCSGVFVGTDGDTSFPELRIEITVADFGDTAEFQAFVADTLPGLALDEESTGTTLAGGTIGQCVRVDRTERCTEHWEQDGFVVGVQVADRVFVDRPSMGAVLGALVPAIVASLASEPPLAIASGVTVPDDVLHAARAGLLAMSTTREVRECPILDQATMNAALAGAGIGLETDDWRLVGTERADGHEGATPGVQCAAGAAHGGVRIEVLDLGNSEAAADVIGLVQGCERADDTEFCVESWEQDGVIVTAVLTAVGIDLTQPGIRALVDVLAPVIITRLAG